MGRYSRNALPALSLALVGGMIAACDEQNTYVPPPPPKVTVATPEKQAVTNYLAMTGTTAASNTVELRARVEGYLDKVLFEDGQRVKQGDLLFVIEQAPYQASVKEAEAGLARAKAQVKQSTLTAERVGKARKSGSVSQQALDEAKAVEAVDAADVLGREAELTKARLDLSYTEVHAPFNGRISRRMKDPGNLVGSGEDTVIAVINQIDPLYVYFTINEEDLLRAQEVYRDSPERAARGGTFPLEMGLANEEGYPYDGTLNYSAITLDGSTGTLLLRGTFDNPEGNIMAGQFARLRVPIVEMQDRIVVPEVAIGYDQQGAYVMVVNADNVVERRAVTLGVAAGDRRVVSDGLKGDERIVVNGLLRAIPGNTVDPVTQSDAKAADTSKPAS